MIYVLVGENAFARELELARIVSGRDAEQLDTSTLELRDLADILSGQTLFSAERVIVLRGASANKALWDALVDRLDTVDATTTLILVETKLDKRTKAYKTLQKTAKVILCDFWTDRQAAQAEQWLKKYAEQQGLDLAHEHASDMVRRATRPSDNDDKPIIDQQLLASVAQQLSLLKSVDTAAIDAVLPPTTHDNVFALLDAALSGDVARIQTMISRLSQHQDGHRTLALLASQVTNLAALNLAQGKPMQQVASDIGANSYALSALEYQAERLDRRTVRLAVESIAAADHALKTGQSDVWSLIESALLKIALAK